jgi:hypothetical protein
MYVRLAVSNLSIGCIQSSLVITLKQELQPDIMHTVFEIGQAILKHQLVKP